MHFSDRFRRHLGAVAVGAALAGSSSVAFAQTIVVQGSQRVDAETIRSYFAGTDQARINEAVRELYSTGLFSDVRVRRDGGRIIVQVVENNVINRVAFEGNSKLKGDVLATEVQTRSRGAYNPATVQADVERIKDIYRRAGRGAANVTARTVALPNGRMDVVFTINEGGKTGVRAIEFVGNNAYSAYRLRNLMQTTEMNWLSFLKNTDVYDPDKISADLEGIRRFYLKNGYADFRIVGSDARYDEAREGYVVTVSVEEGAPYTVSAVNVDSRLTDVDPQVLRDAVKLSPGDVYNGDLVERSVEALTREVARKGYAFSSARPRGDRDPVTHTVALSFVVEEGPRVYVERIVVRGNTRTRDYVIRREFDLGEGDAYNRVLVDRAERRLNNLGFFKKVRIVNEPGSAPDRVVVVVDVEDQPTGSFGVSGGYSTQDGIIGEVSVSESNFLGRGQYVRAAATLGQRTRGIDLSFTEPYFMGSRIAAGFDLFHKQNIKSTYSLYDTYSTGATLRAGIPITNELSVGLRYSIYQTRIKIPNDSTRPFNDCTSPIPGLTPTVGGTPALDPADTSANLYTCVTNGEASLAIKEAAGTRLTSAVGSTFSYNTLDNARNPTKGLYAELRTDVAGLGGDSKWIRGQGDIRYYYPVWDDVVAFGRLQGGHISALGGTDLRVIDNFNLGPSLVRGFAPGGIGPRDVTPGINNRTAALGGTSYFGGSVEMQFPIWGLPREVGLKGALFADAGTLFGYNGRT
ncbi:MAG: outer membrane protein assembly complex, YaeT protein, partial [Hyphomicrobiales bacterium]|nr:outer membrane protein assembly complex, YaeT protein [Hyphomicrobiales bacterium]